MFPENTHCHRDTEGESNRQRASEREIMSERRRERDYNVAANECQRMLYIISHHASLNITLCFATLAMSTGLQPKKCNKGKSRKALNEYITTASIILANDENVPGQQ